MQFVGDEVFAVFGVPVADDTMATEALRSVLEMQDEIAGWRRHASSSRASSSARRTTRSSAAFAPASNSSIAGVTCSGRMASNAMSHSSWTSAAGIAGAGIRTTTSPSGRRIAPRRRAASVS